MNIPKRSLIFDGNYMLHRVLHLDAFNNLSTSKGVFTGGIFGVLKGVFDCIHRFNPHRVYYVWDGGISPTRRLLLGEGNYKGNRRKKEEDITDEDRKFYENLQTSKDRLKEYLPYFNIYSLCYDEIEGDDLCYMLAKQFCDESVVVSDDRDFFQFVSEKCSVYRPINKIHLTLENFTEITKVKNPCLYKLYHAIGGDTSDNIAGIPGCGETSISIAVNEWGQDDFSHLSQFFEFCSTHKNGRVKKIAQNKDLVIRNLKMVDLKVAIGWLDVVKPEIEKSIENYQLLYNQVDALTLLGKLECKSLVENSPSWLSDLEILS